MTNVLLKDVLSRGIPNQLPSKEIFGKVDPIESIKPEIGVSGLKIRDSDQENSHTGSSDTPIIATASNFYKERGAVVSNEGFIRLPKDLLKSEEWKNLRLKQQKLFLFILSRAQYTPYTFNYNGTPINLMPGDLCISLRRLVDDFNCSVKFKDEKIDLPFVQRSVSAFSKKGLTDTLTDTGITVIRVIYPGIYDTNKNPSDTASDTDSIQLRYTNEERIEGKDMKETIDGATALDRSFLLNMENGKEDKPSIFDAPTPNPTRQKKKPMTPEQEKHYQDAWKYLCEKRMAEGYTDKNAKGHLIKGVKSADLIKWIQDKEFKVIVDVIKRTYDSGVQSTYPGYMETLFAKNVTKKASNIEINDAYLKEVMKKYKCTHLEDTKQYVQDKIKHIDYQKNLEPERFKEMIDRSIQMAESYSDRDTTNDEEY